MLTLSPTDFLVASCPTASAITYTIFGDTIISGMDSFAVIAQGQIANTPTTIVPTNTNQRLLKTITLANTTNASVPNIKLFVNGSTSPFQIINLAIPAFGSAKFDASGWSVYDASGSLLTFGLNGRGIISIAKTNTTGLVDTYTITYSDNSTSTFTVTNGRGIASIAKTNTTGLVDTYTITYNDGSTSTYTVTNGRGIASIALTNTTGLVDTYTITYNDGSTSTYTITNGAQGYIGGITQQFSTTTTATDPGSGKFQFNNATIASVTAIYVDDLSFSGSTGLAAEFATWDDSTSTIKGKLIVRNNVNGSSVYAIFNINTVTTNAGFSTIGVTYVTGSGTFTNNDLFALQFARTGDKGDTGQAAYTTTTANFTQPAAAGTVSVSVVNTQWMSVGMYLFIATGGYYTVQSITNTTTVVLVNTGVPENANAGTTINSGSSVSSGGSRGATGPQGQSVAVADEGNTLTSAATSINFTGAGVTATNTGSAVTVTINGGNAFSSVTGNTGTSTADSPGDTIGIVGTNGIGTLATEQPDSLIIFPSYGTPTGLAPDSTNSDGTANTFARSDHVHATPTDIAVSISNANSEGTSTSFARSDHTHAGVSSITQGAGITVNQSQGAVTVTNADRGTTAVTTHEGLADPHPQYTTAAEASAAAPVQSVNGQTGAVTISVPVGVSAVLSATQANSTVTPAVLTGHSFTVPPGRTIFLNGQLIATAAATTTGIAYGVQVVHGAGANGNAQGSWAVTVAITSAAAATALHDGDAFNVAAGATANGEVLGATTIAGNNHASMHCVVTNRSTNVNTTVNVIFRSEVAGSAVTAQIGTGAAGMII